MASLKAEKPVGSQLFGPVKKDNSAKSSTEGSSKAPASASKKKSAASKSEPKKKAKAGKSASKH